MSKLKTDQEPVAWGVIKRGERVWYINDSKSVCEGYASHYAHHDANGSDQSVIPLYTHPARTLSDEEILDIYGEKCDSTVKKYVLAFARAVLKEASK